MRNLRILDGELLKNFSNTKTITEIEGKGITIKEVSVCVKTTRDVEYAYKTVWTNSVNRKAGILSVIRFQRRGNIGKEFKKGEEKYPP